MKQRHALLTFRKNGSQISGKIQAIWSSLDRSIAKKLFCDILSFFCFFFDNSRNSKPKGTGNTFSDSANPVRFLYQVSSYLIICNKLDKHLYASVKLSRRKLLPTSVLLEKNMYSKLLVNFNWLQGFWAKYYQENGSLSDYQNNPEILKVFFVDWVNYFGKELSSWKFNIHKEHWLKLSSNSSDSF